MLKQVFLACFEPVVMHFGPWKKPKCLENGPLWDKKWLKNGSKTCFSWCAHGVCVLSQGVLGAFHGHHADLVSVEQHLRSQLEELYPTAFSVGVYHLGRRDRPYLFEHSTVLLVKTHGLGPAVPQFLTQKSFTNSLWVGLAILWWW